VPLLEFPTYNSPSTFSFPPLLFSNFYWLLPPPDGLDLVGLRPFHLPFFVARRGLLLVLPSARAIALARASPFPTRRPFSLIRVVRGLTAVLDVGPSRAFFFLVAGFSSFSDLARRLKGFFLMQWQPFCHKSNVTTLHFFSMTPGSRSS